jgi:hypothetical protein
MKTLKRLAGICFVLFLSILGAFTIAPLIGVTPIYVFAPLVAAGFIPGLPGVLATFVFSAPGGAATAFSFPLTYLPQFITFTNAVALTSLKIETTEDGVIQDYTAAGMVAAANFMCLGAQVANMLLLRVADGQINKKTVTISGVTSGAGVVPFYVNSDHYGSVPYKFKNTGIQALTPTTFEKFIALFLPTMATGTDRAEVTFNSGLQMTYQMEDLQRLSAAYNQVSTIAVNNICATIDHVDVTCAAITPAYVLSYLIKGQ